MAENETIGWADALRYMLANPGCVVEAAQKTQFADVYRLVGDLLEVGEGNDPVTWRASGCLPHALASKRFVKPVGPAPALAQAQTIPCPQCRGRGRMEYGQSHDAEGRFTGAWMRPLKNGES